MFQVGDSVITTKHLDFGEFEWQVVEPNSEGGRGRSNQGMDYLRLWSYRLELQLLP